MDIVTKQLADNLPQSSELLRLRVVDPNHVEDLYHVLFHAENFEIKIYDYTSIPRIEENTVIPVKDHINRTGENPLIKMKKHLDFDFIDISDLYNYTGKGIVTNCCGENFNSDYDYPSYYLCHVSILAKAIGIQKIEAFLVNLK